ncbi:GNAT family N-acetyltransferase [Pedobacter antarcticus]|uniref:GNAT family N-acetyltransferase n=1 Tax=Pedobacter antarcticus TaxID=34086 RepID=UPI00292D630D|nr:GNAT family N-acetyltransferase [Pedobacter antarcticus]
MYFQSVESAHDPNLDYVFKLYTSAFPVQERRDWPQLLGMIGNTSEMDLKLILVGDQIIGFVILWHLQGWDYIEHFAVDPQQRGKRYGEQVMQILLKGNRLILEVEPPETTDAVRRIRFYEKLGLCCLGVPYQQPCYREPEKEYRLILMSNYPHESPDVYLQIIEEIKRKVYGR